MGTMAQPVRCWLRGGAAGHNPRRARAGPRAAGLAGLWGALALLAVPALGGCVDAATPASGNAGSILGGWTLQADPTCRESLAFLPGGRFRHGVGPR